MTGQPNPPPHRNVGPHVTPQEIACLMIRAYENPLVSNNTAIKPLFLEGLVCGRGWLISQKEKKL